MSAYLVGDKAQSSKENRCKKQNNTDSKRLEQELERIQKQQQIWLKEQSFETRKLKLKINNQQKTKKGSVSLPSSPFAQRTFSFDGKTPNKRKQTIS